MLRGDALESEILPKDAKAAGELAGAQELYRAGDYSKAGRVFHKVAENKKNPPAIAEEARYYEAECLRQQRHYPNAADTYNRMLIDFPSGAFREQAVQRLIGDRRVEAVQHHHDALLLASQKFSQVVLESSIRALNSGLRLA